MGARCPICNRDYANKQAQTFLLSPLSQILGGVALLALFIILVWDRKPISLASCKDPIPPPELHCPTAPLVRLDYSWQPKRFNWGQRTLFPHITSPNRHNGIQAFKQGDYKKASLFFEKAVIANRNDPEPLILLNNATSASSW